jgi:hypothetical protein
MYLPVASLVRVVRTRPYEGRSLSAPRRAVREIVAPVCAGARRRTSLISPPLALRCFTVPMTPDSGWISNGAVTVLPGDHARPVQVDAVSLVRGAAAACVVDLE